MIRQGMIKPEIDHAEAVYRYRKAIKKGVVKVMSKMGITTIQSYRGAQIFEAIGLNEEFVDTYFDKTPSRIGGVGLEEIAAETLDHHRRAYAAREVGPASSSRRRPVPVAPRRRVPPVQPRDRLQAPARHPGRPLRHLQEVHQARQRPERAALHAPRPVRRSSSTSASRCRSRRSSRSSRSSSGSPPARCRYGSISGEAHETLAIAMNRLGGKSNTGEGGEDPARFKPHAQRRLASAARSSRWPRAGSA